VPWEVSFDVEALIDNLGQEIGGKKKQVEVNQGELKNKRTGTGQGGFRGRNSGGGFIFVSMETRLPRRLFVFISPKKKTGNYCQPVVESFVSWTLAGSGITLTENCPSGMTGRPMRTCGNSGNWGPISNPCVT